MIQSVFLSMWFRIGIVIVLAMLILVGLASHITTNAFYKQQSSIMHQLIIGINSSNMAELNPLGIDSYRYSRILPTGEIIQDSDVDIVLSEPADKKPEVAQALNGDVGRSRRFSKNAQEDYIFVAKALRKSNGELEVVRLGMPLSLIQLPLRQSQRAIWEYLAILLGLAIGAAGLVARRLSADIGKMKTWANKVEENAQASLPKLSHATLDIWVRRLRNQIQRADRKNGSLHEKLQERNRILHHMVDGILFVDMNGRIIDINPAARRFFQIEADDDLKGKQVEAVIRNSDVLAILKDVHAQQSYLERDVTLTFPQERYISINAMLLERDKHPVGALMVFHDLSKIKKLEKIRETFVANVSHELKTPITLISGAIETLERGAINDDKKRQTFLGMIGKNAIRLNDIVDDLLSLAEIEQGQESLRDDIRDENLVPHIQSAIDACSRKAHAKNSIIRYEETHPVRLKVNGRLLEQAVINLVANAVKYSPEKSHVSIGIEDQQDGVTISVSDNGPGIGKEHLDHVFERFYRVDKARGRDVGGTGLGLSIVKHIAKLHGGDVTVDSVLGKGTTFAIQLPRS